MFRTYNEDRNCRALRNEQKPEDFISNLYSIAKTGYRLKCIWCKTRTMTVSENKDKIER